MANGRPERRLILIRHSVPEIDPSLPANRWLLSELGRERCRWLAERLAVLQPAWIVTSLEPKALETGRIVGKILSVPVETGLDLHEHERPGVGLFANHEQFRSLVLRLFEQPGELVFGRETADQAHSRFARGIARVLDDHPGGNIAVVTHGTVMSLFGGRATGLDPAQLWLRLGLPALIALSWPGLDLLEMVEGPWGQNRYNQGLSSEPESSSRTESSV